MLFDFSPAAQIRFIKLSDYCVAEYIMEPVGSSIFTTSPFYLLENSFNNSKQVYNSDGSLLKTGNIKDLSVASFGDNFVAYLDSEKVPNYTSYDANLTETALAVQPVVTDTIKLHFITGFEFDDFEALVVSVRANMNNGNQCILANILLAPQTFNDILKFNSKPMYLGEGVYDRYVIFKIPSLRNINTDYYAASNKSTTFGYKMTNGVGLVNYDPISLVLAECDWKKTLYGTNQVNYDTFQINEIFTASISQVSELADFGATIYESEVGDYIEYYGIWNGGFPSELIATLNKKNAGDDWILIHQLEVHEQVGTAFIRTSFLSIYQEDAFDEPLLYRPILKHAHEAISASIDYTLRLFNRANGDQEIRTSSMTIVNPNKYGRKLTKIPLFEAPQSNKIYNKIVQKSFDSSILFIEPNPNAPAIVQQALTQPAQPTVITKTEFVPMFYTNTNISVAEKNQMITTIDSSEVIVFGQGKLPIIVTPFDNIIKLKVFTKTATATVPFNLNLNSNLKLVFNSRQNRISFSNLNDQTKENLGEGEVVFRLSKDESLKILNSSDRVFYLTCLSSDGTETPLYAGMWYTEEERDTVNQMYLDAIAALKPQVKPAQTATQDASPIASGPAIRTNENLMSILAEPENVVTIPGYVEQSINNNQTSVIQKQVPESLKGLAKTTGFIGKIAKKAIDKLTH